MTKPGCDLRSDALMASAPMSFLQPTMVPGKDQSAAREHVGQLRNLPPLGLGAPPEPGMYVLVSGTHFKSDTEESLI